MGRRPRNRSNSPFKADYRMSSSRGGRTDHHDGDADDGMHGILREKTQRTATADRAARTTSRVKQRRVFHRTGEIRETVITDFYEQNGLWILF